MPTVKHTDQFHRTRFDDGEQRLMFSRVGLRYWSFFHQVGTDEPARVGPLYATLSELMGDEHRFGTDFGF